jgi:hypothetical protein
MEGNPQQFVKDLVWCAVALMLVSYVGATVLSILDMNPKDLETLLPTNIYTYPYSAPAGTSAKDLDKGVELDKILKPDGTGNFTAALLEYLYPMKSVSFPYTSWFMHPNFKGTKGHTIAQWFALTCANVFIWWRSFYKALYLVGNWLRSVTKSAGDIGDLFLFFVYPYILYYLVFLPIVPFIGFVLAILGSSQHNIPGSHMLTLAPIFGTLFAIGNLIGGGVFNVYAWMISGVIYFSGFAIAFVSFCWWCMLGGALWLYSIMFLVFAPFWAGKDNAMQHIMVQLKLHIRSICTIFVLYTAFAATKNFAQSTELLAGISVGTLFCLYQIYYMETPA